MVVGFVMVGSYYCSRGRYKFSLDIGSFVLNSIKNLIVTYCMHIIQMDVEFRFFICEEFFNG